MWTTDGNLAATSSSVDNGGAPANVFGAAPAARIKWWFNLSFIEARCQFAGVLPPSAIQTCVKVHNCPVRSSVWTATTALYHVQRA